uniref:Hyaluronidase n=1 Tax=Prolemur simus TaxID=1328070 RepID=A0A8C8YNZ8_PROSS
LSAHLGITLIGCWADVGGRGWVAPPLIPNVPFLWAWNAPTELCIAGVDGPLDLSLFSLVGSPRENVTGQNITIFYTDRLGYYPYIDMTGRSVNGGIPQKASLKKHLDKAKKDIDYYMPINDTGLAVIDWKEWRPTWARNWKPKHVYRNESIELVQKHNTQLDDTEATNIAIVEFEKAAKNFMQETLKLGKLLRPHRLWGYYLFPDCYNYNYNQHSFTGSCYDIEKRRNDHLDWLWNESTALFPSIYLTTRLSPPQIALYVRNRIYEAIRISRSPDMGRPLPVFVYARPVFTDLVLKYLSQDDLVNTLGESIALGASGVVIWGGLSMLRSVVSELTSCSDLDDYLRTTLNPYLINITLAAKMCNQLGKGLASRRLIQEYCLSPAFQGFSELWSCHCTLVWVTEPSKRLKECLLQQLGWNCILKASILIEVTQEQNTKYGMFSLISGS